MNRLLQQNLPYPDVLGAIFSSRQRLCHFAGTFDEALDQRVQRPGATSADVAYGSEPELLISIE
jgi:hypothetical protein